jgi:hypothetical protein
MSPIVVTNSSPGGRVKRVRGGSAPSYAFDGPAELPRALEVDPLIAFNARTFFTAYTPRVNHTPTTPAELNTLLTGGTLGGQTLQRGDFITCTAATEYTSATRRTQTFPALSGTFTWNDPATWVWVRSSAEASLVAPRTRVASSDATALTAIANCARFDTYQNGGGVYPVIVADGASGYCFSGIGGRTLEGNWTGGNRYWLAAGVKSTQTTFAHLPDGVVLDRCIFVGDPRNWTDKNPALGSTPHGLYVNCKRFILTDSWIDAGASAGTLGLEGGGTENQALSAAHWTGPGLIDNNTLIASGENIVTGGDDPSVGELRTIGTNPTDVVFSRNYCPSRPAWNIRSASSDGYGVQCKNNFELKKGVRWLIEGNAFDYWFMPDQAKIINIKRTNQAGGDTKCQTQDITVRYNRITNTPTFINFSNDANAADTAVDRVSVHDNLVVLNQTDEFTDATGPAYTVDSNAPSTLFNNNTMLRVADSGRGSSGTLRFIPPTVATSLTMTDNVIPHVGSLILRYDGVGGSANGWNTTATRYTTASGSSNLQIGGNSGTGLGTAFGAVAADNAAAFVNAAGGDYTIAATYATGSSVGGPPGANLTTLATKTSGAITGSW